MAITNTKQLRQFLANQLERAASGELDHRDGRNVVGLANQITSNMKVELQAAELKMKLGLQVEAFGALEV